MAYQSNPIFEVLTDSDKITCRAVGAVTPGPVQVAAGGKVVPATTGKVVGQVHADAANNADAAVALSI